MPRKSQLTCGRQPMEVPNEPEPPRAFSCSSSSARRLSSPEILRMAAWFTFSPLSTPTKFHVSTKGAPKECPRTSLPWHCVAKYRKQKKMLLFEHKPVTCRLPVLTTAPLLKEIMGRFFCALLVYLTASNHSSSRDYTSKRLGR